MNRPGKDQRPSPSGDGMILRQWDRFEATFRPRRTDDLKLGVEDWIGVRVAWDCAWEIEDGPYAGEFACTLADPPEKHPGFVWAPSGDLRDIVPLRRTDLREFMSAPESGS